MNTAIKRIVTNAVRLLAACGFVINAIANTPDKPNIVILFTDDMGYADLGSYGNPYIRTPNLDQMAREGQRWTDFYVAAPVCSPSRGSLLTGQLSVRTGLYGRKLHVMHPGDSNGIPRDLVTLPEALKSAGYRTGMFGKWHLGDAPDNYPTRHGFDYWYGVPYSNDMDRVGAPDFDELMKMVAEGKGSQASSYFKETIRLFHDNPKSEYWNIPLYRSERRNGDFHDEIIQRPLHQPTFTQKLTEEAIAFIKQNKGSPFFAYVPYSMPHLPVFSSSAFEGKSLRGAYGDTVEEIDWSVGRILQTLKEQGLANNTLVLFTSDNGPWQLVSTTLAGSAGMLRGAKATTYEGGVRVPGIFWWPGKVKPGVVSDMGTTMDVYATALKLAGVDLPEQVDGLDLTTTLVDGAASPRDEFPYYYEGNLTAYRKGRYKLFLYADGQSKEPLDKPVLYDLHEDISEKVDIAETHPDVVKDLMASIEQHRQQVTIADPIFDRRLSAQ